MILKKYVKPLKSNHIDTLVLGCTHYPVMIDIFRQVMGKKVHIPHPGEIVAHSLKDYLKRHQEIDKLLTKNGTRTYLTTDNPERFIEIGSRFMGQQLKDVKQCQISK